MATPCILLLLPLFLIPISSSSSFPPSSLVLSSCAHARYPSLCIRTLSPSAARTPPALAVDAVSAAATSAHSALSFLHRFSHPPPTVRDCAEQISDSRDQLASAAAEIRSLRRENSRWQLDNALTWASAALTDQDTCLDAIRRLPPSARRSVSAHVSEARRVTCNALYFVSRLAGATPHRRR
ncbi:pectinesterase inhibitor 3-like [Phalaenopsis equestris]|uniref:pectinesterase inhibitor 3-like n=1 Tax=Phalaenopsis equestris TaxID=78828 RepID=UPI0009E60255|nr:pectinesterase inhibitor 3-like [Phalaenopsis equestris]